MIHTTTQTQAWFLTLTAGLGAHATRTTATNSWVGPGLRYGRTTLYRSPGSGPREGEALYRCAARWSRADSATAFLKGGYRYTAALTTTHNHLW